MIWQGLTLINDVPMGTSTLVMRHYIRDVVLQHSDERRIGPGSAGHLCELAIFLSLFFYPVDGPQRRDSYTS
jgi:hypothetical protein